MPELVNNLWLSYATAVPLGFRLMINAVAAAILLSLLFRLLCIVELFIRILVNVLQNTWLDYRIRTATDEKRNKFIDKYNAVNANYNSYRQKKRKVPKFLAPVKALLILAVWVGLVYTLAPFVTSSHPDESEFLYKGVEAYLIFERFMVNLPGIDHGMTNEELFPHVLLTNPSRIRSYEVFSCFKKIAEIRAYWEPNWDGLYGYNVTVEYNDNTEYFLRLE